MQNFGSSDELPYLGVGRFRFHLDAVAGYEFLPVQCKIPVVRVSRRMPLNVRSSDIPCETIFGFPTGHEC